MRILAVIHEFPPIGAGGGMVLDALSSELAGLGHEMDIVTAAWGDLPRHETRDRVVIHRIPCRRRRRVAPSVAEMLAYVTAARRYALTLVGEQDYDLIYGTCILPSGLVARQLHRRTGLPYVLTATGSDVPGYNPHRFGLMHRLLLPVWRGIIRDAQAVTCKSDWHAELTRTAFGSDPQNLVVIPNAIDTNAMKPRPTSLREKRILGVGRMVELKGYQYLIEAMAGLETDYRLELVGDGPYVPELRQLARALHVPVEFHGWLDKSTGRLQDLYEGSSIFVHPSLVESFGTVVLEAMLAGLPIVATRGIASTEVAGEACLQAAPASVEELREAIVALIREPELQAQLGAAGRKRAEECFSWPAIGLRYERVMEVAIGGRDPL